jgi:hypothetical protein
VSIRGCFSSLLVAVMPRWVLCGYFGKVGKDLTNPSRIVMMRRLRLSNHRRAITNERGLSPKSERRTWHGSRRPVEIDAEP